MQKIKTVGIAGAGTMGSGIALVCARAGYNVILADISSAMLDKAKTSIESSLQKLCDSGKMESEKMIATAAQISYSSEPQKMTADLIIEAIVEKADVKIELFKNLISINGRNCIYASNTSSIPISQIAAGISEPQLLVGIHFFNPAHIMKLVEVIKGARTMDDIVQTAVNFVTSLDKQAVVAADAPGFIVNRIARLYYVEALKMLEEGVADFKTIDAVMESCGFKMGPFKLMDLIGVDTNYSVTESQYKLFNHEARFRPSRIQKQKVDAGMHGKKTGEGFYKYE